MRESTAQSPKESFRQAVESTARLQLKPGLQAVKRGEGHGRILAKEPKRLLGSVAIDDDCLVDYPNDHRWDYVIGYDGEGVATANFVEVHSAETSNVSDVANKLRWLKGFLLESTQSKLAALPRTYHWVASGKVNIPRHTPQYKTLNVALRKQGLQGPVTRLVLD
jgi:hypothetical protein